MTSQLQLLNKILDTKDFSIITLNNLTDQYFFNYKDEFNYIKNHYEQYKTVPDKLTLLNVFPNFDCTTVSEPDAFLLEQLYKDYNTSYLATRFNDIKKFIETDNIDKAVDYFLKSVENLHNGEVLTCTNLLSDTSRYDHYIDKASNWTKYYISSGFPELDKLIGGIDRENENMVLIARPGVGKSWTLLKMAVSASMQGLTVGIYSGEMSVDKVGYRVDTLMGHIKNSSIMRGDLYVQKEYKKYIESLSATNFGAIKVVTPNDISGPATVPALQAFIEREHLQILFIDQYSLLEDSRHGKTDREMIANLSKDIKNLQVKMRIPIIAVSQQNRTKNEDGTIDTSMVYGSDRIGQDATIVIAIEKKDSSMTLNILKARDGGDNQRLEYNVDLNEGKFTFIPQEDDGVSSDADFEALANSYTTDNSNGDVF